MSLNVHLVKLLLKEHNLAKISSLAYFTRRASSNYGYDQQIIPRTLMGLLARRDEILYVRKGHCLKQDKFYLKSFVPIDN